MKEPLALTDQNPPDMDRFYGGLFDCIGSPILVLDTETTAILNANSAACSFYGYDRHEITQKKIQEIAVLLPEEIKVGGVKIVAGEITRMTSKHRLANGELREVEVDFGRGNLGDRQVQIVTVHDITAEKQTVHKLNERVKELSAFYAISKIVEEGKQPEQVYQQVIDILPQSWQYPEITCSKLTLNTRQFASVNFRKTQWQQSAPIKIRDKTIGSIEIGYLESRPQEDEGPFLKEERFLLDAIAERLGKIVALLQAEQELRESEARYHALFENMHEGFALHEIIQDEAGRVVDFRFVDANRAYEQHTGLKPEEIIGHTLREITPNADPAMIERYGTVTLTGEPLDFEYYSRTFNRHIRVRAFRPQPNRFASIFEDITERKTAEFLVRAVNTELEKRVEERTAELHESEEKYSTLFEKLAVPAVLIKAPEVTILDINEAGENLLGYTRQEAFGKTAPELGLWSAEQREQIISEFKEHDELKNFEVRVRQKSGKEIIALNNTVHISIGGQPFVITTLIDITERKQAEELLRESHFRTRMAVHGANTGTWEWNVQTGETVFNERWAEIVGYSLKELEPVSIQTWLDLCHPDDLSLSNERLNQCFTGESEFYECEVRMKHKNGSWIWVIDRGKVMDWTADGEPLRMFGTHLDITERKQSEKRLIETNIALEKAMRAKDEFMAVMSHELRTPLNSVINLAELLQMTAADSFTEKQLMYIITIERSGRRLLDMVTDILEFTQLQGGAYPLELGSCTLSEVCKEALQQIAPLAAPKQQQTYYSAKSENIQLQTDRKCLYKILSLLLDNASKFTDPGGEFGIEITGGDDARLVEITVWDTGIGISEENFPRLFKPFVQLDAKLTRQYEGAGLGLALVKGLTELLGGTVGVQSTLGKGSRFIVSLPRKEGFADSRIGE